MVEHLSLEDAVASHVTPGDAVHVVCGHSRWTAAARELARQHWEADAGFTLIMVSLSTLGSLFFRGRMVRKVVTAYSGDTFPTYTPNPFFQKAYASGEVEVEHWSILTFAQRLEAAARGLPALVTGSLEGSSMQSNEGYASVDSPFGKVGLVSPLVPDVTLLHAAVADRAGNVAMCEPLLEGVWGAWAARRGVIATVESVVDSLGELGLGRYVRIPSHRVLAVVEAPLGAHPGGLHAPGLPVSSYGEDIAFWAEAKAATRGDFDEWVRRWVLEPRDQLGYVERLGAERVEHLKSRTDPESWREDARLHPVDADQPVTGWELAAAHGAREILRVVDSTGADAVLAGAGVANLSAWVAVASARSKGSRLSLTAELGMFGYEPTPADPYIFNHRTFPSTAMLSDAQSVLGMVVGGPGTTTVACLGAAQVDQHGNLNSTTLAPRGPFLVGSGGANDVASRAAACVVIALARPERIVEQVEYVTSPGRNVVSVVTELGVLRRAGDRFEVSAVAFGKEPLDERVRRLRESCGWEVRSSATVEEMDEVTADEVLALRRYDPERLFLS